MNKIVGLSVFWLAADFLAGFLSPNAAGVVGLFVLLVVLTGLGSMLLSPIFRDNSGHLFAGFMLAFPGWLLTEFVFHWHLLNPAACTTSAAYPTQCGFGTLIGYMIANLFIVGVEMAIVAIPAIPLLLKMRKQ